MILSAGCWEDGAAAGADLNLALTAGLGPVFPTTWVLDEPRRPVRRIPRGREVMIYKKLVLYDKWRAARAK